jgi:hypothetical protein
VNTQEREFVVTRLRESRDRLLHTLGGLSPEQQTFRPAEDQWSVADCAEHVGMVENVIYERIQKALQEPPAPEKQPEVQSKTDFLLRALPDRSTRIKGPERLMPRREWKEFSELVAAFEAARKRTIDFASRAEADLHSHFFPHIVFSDLDCYQWLVLAALHCDRHVLQMKEVMAAPGYPQKVAGQSV